MPARRRRAIHALLSSRSDSCSRSLLPALKEGVFPHRNSATRSRVSIYQRAKRVSRVFCHAFRRRTHLISSTEHCCWSCLTCGFEVRKGRFAPTSNEEERGMLRAYARFAVVTFTALTLTVVAIPAADARPLATRTVPSVEQSWFAIAFSWLSTFVPSLSHPSGGGMVQKTAAATQIPVDPNAGQHGSHPMSGGCIDPGGAWVPCSH